MIACIRKHGKMALVYTLLVTILLLVGCNNGQEVVLPKESVVSTQKADSSQEETEEEKNLVYLSPSKQFDNDYVIEGTEGHYMYRIAEAIIPYLEASGVDYILGDREDELMKRTEQANAAECDLYLSIHSNGADGKRRGALIFYQKENVEGEQFAEIIASNFRKISPTPTRVFTQFDPWQKGEKGFIETREPNCMAALVEVAYHDNLEDANWIKNNVEIIAKNLAQSITETLGVTFQEP